LDNEEIEGRALLLLVVQIPMLRVTRGARPSGSSTACPQDIQMDGARLRMDKGQPMSNIRSVGR